MKNIIVTAGEAFTDVDALACAIAYAELLKLEGKNTEVVLPGPLNHSVTPTLKSWGLQYVTRPTFPEYESVLVDVSEASHFAKCVDQNFILEVYDHRYGFEDYWNKILGANSHIELVGSCATLIWEEFVKRGFTEKISTLSANLLLIAVVSNTLSFKAQITHERDIKAFKELQKHTSLPTDWLDTYFQEQEDEVFNDVSRAIIGDTKVLTIPSISFPIVMGQIELWDSSNFIEKYENEIKVALKSFGNENWFMSLPCIKEGKNYFYTESDLIRHLLIKHVGAKFEQNGFIGTTDKLWLRKEVRSEFIKDNI